MTLVAWVAFFLAALLEVGGDAIIRKGLRGGGWLVVAGGVLFLGAYGLLVNSVRWDFSKVFGVYVGVFALVAVLVAKHFLKESIPTSTWLGLALIILGGFVIQFGAR